MSPRPESRLSKRRLQIVTLIVFAALLALVGMSSAAWALYTGNSDNNGNELVAATDWIAPTATTSVIGKTLGGTPGYIRQGGVYYVYANASDSGGAPASGISSVTANVSAITPAQTATALLPGTFAIGGVAYNYRSAARNVNATLPAGTYTYALTSKDSAGNSRTQSGYTVIVENTAPTAIAIETTNKVGNTVGRAEIGDSIAFTFSEPIEPASVLAGWTGAATNVVVRINNGVNDPLSVYNPANTAQLALGSVTLGRSDYATGSNATFGVTGTASTMVLNGDTITVTLGTAAGGVSTAPSTGTMVWSPSPNTYDRAANAGSIATLTEAEPADGEF